jgi:hypothetical protein
LWDAQGVQSAVGTAAVDDINEMILEERGEKRLKKKKKKRKRRTSQTLKPAVANQSHNLMGTRNLQRNASQSSK